ncbi:MAG: signal recognition particle protein Srp54 [Sulfolobaceae archaeon]
MVLESLKDAVRKFLTGSTPYERAVEDFIKDLQKALISSDVNVKVVFSLTNKIKERLVKEKPPSLIEQKDWFIKIVYEELVNLFGGDLKPNVNPSKLPYTIMLVGVQGSGKTTTAGKLAYFYKRRGYKVGLVSTDVYRPAAFEQLKQLGDSIKVPVFIDYEEKDPVKIAEKAVKKLINEGFEIIIIDTAGRHGYGEEVKLLEEMKKIYEKIKPDEVILVLDAAIGQKAYDLASKFHSASPVGSIIITKMDGTAKGGGAISAVVATGARIKFLGTGEKIDEIEVFEPRRFVSRILGMGDIEAILERIKSIEEYEEIERKVEEVIEGKSKLTLRDIYKQLIAVRKMGPLSKIIKNLPGFSLITNIPEDQLKIGEEKMKKWLAILNSMTYKELDNPGIIDKSRMRRIARGAGVSPEEVKEFLEYYNTLNKMMRNIRRYKGLERFLERFKGAK